MIITNSQIDDAVQATIKQLKRSGVAFDSDEYGMLKEAIIKFVEDDCEHEVRDSVAFGDLENDQWSAWMGYARTLQALEGGNPDEISSEETEKQALYLFVENCGTLPE